MQQHPVPQNITGFEFKLIGFLTVRQFAYLAAAGVVDVVFYLAKLPAIILILLCGPLTLLAVALALFRINDQPFERWLASFLKTIYSPTIRVWHREPKTLGFLEPQFSFYLQTRQANFVPRHSSDRSKLEQYLASHKKVKVKSNVDLNEEQRLAQLPFDETDKQVFTAPNLNVPQAEFNKTLQETQPRLQRMDEVLSQGDDLR